MWSQLLSLLVTVLLVRVVRHFQQGIQDELGTVREFLQAHTKPVGTSNEGTDRSTTPIDIATSTASSNGSAGEFWIQCNSSQKTTAVNLFDYDVLVVGAGLSGAVLAQQHAERLHQRVLVLEKRNHIAGNTYVHIWINRLVLVWFGCMFRNNTFWCFVTTYIILLSLTHTLCVQNYYRLLLNRYDFINSLNIRISQYGPHLFHTKSQTVWDYVQRFANWTKHDHRVVGRVDGSVLLFQHRYLTAANWPFVVVVVDRFLWYIVLVTYGIFEW